MKVKELLGQNKREIWSLSECNGTRTHNHLVCKQTLKWLSVCLRTKWLWFQVLLQSGFISFIRCRLWVCNDTIAARLYSRLVLKTFMFHIFFDSKIKWNTYSIIVRTGNALILRGSLGTLTSLFQKKGL